MQNSPINPTPNNVMLVGSGTEAAVAMNCPAKVLLSVAVGFVHAVAP